MFINPDDRRVGNRRQQLTRQKIEAQLDNENRRRRGMSRFAQTGQDRLARGRRAPLRGAGAAPRMAAARGAGGLTAFLGGRVPGNPNARIPVEPPAVAPPRIGPPPAPPRLPGDGPGRGQQPVALDILRDLFDYERTTPALAGGGLDQLLGPQNPNPLSPAILDQLLGGGGPTSPVSGGIDLAGLVPLGGGVWFDPASGQIHGGAGNSSNYAM